MIGDADPEDAFDATDHPDLQLDVLERVVTDLQSDPGDDRHVNRRDDALRLVLNLGRRRDVDRRRLDAVRDALEAL